MAITYNAGTEIISIIGYTEAVPCKCLDIYNADVAGGWGVFTNPESQIFVISCKGLLFGDGTTATWFSDNQKHLRFSNNTNYSLMVMECKANSSIEFGKYNVKGFGYDGCTFSVNAVAAWSRFVYNYGTMKFYGCKFTVNPLGMGVTLNANLNSVNEIYDCISDYSYVGLIIQSTGQTVTVKRYTIIKPNIALRVIGGNFTFENFDVFDPVRSNVLIQSGGVVTAKNCYMPDDPTYSLWVYTGGGTINLINPNKTDYTIYWSANGSIYYKFEFDLLVLDETTKTPINGAVVTLKDKNGNTVFTETTNANGKITTQEVTTKSVIKSGNVTTTEYTPHTIQIRKEGSDYLTYKSKFDFTEKYTGVISMVDMSNVTDKLDAIQLDLDNPNQYKADVEDLEKLVKAAVVFSV